MVFILQLSSPGFPPSLSPPPPPRPSRRNAGGSSGQSQAKPSPAQPARSRRLRPLPCPGSGVSPRCRPHSPGGSRALPPSFPPAPAAPPPAGAAPGAATSARAPRPPPRRHQHLPGSGRSHPCPGHAGSWSAETPQRPAWETEIIRGWEQIATQPAVLKSRTK